MGFKLSDAIPVARAVLNDTDTEGYRYSNDDLVAIGNGALRALAEIKPEWLAGDIEFACAAGASQSLPETEHAFLGVVMVKNGSVVTPTDKTALDVFMPGWRNQAAQPTVHWMPDAGKLDFLVYPPSSAGQVLIVRSVRVPGPYALDDDTGLPETLTEAVADYMVSVAEARNDEDVLTQRSSQFLSQFAARLGAKQG